MKRDSVQFKIWTGVFGVAIGLLIVLLFVNIGVVVQRGSDIPWDTQIDHYTVSGYAQEENLYTNTVGDANIQLPPLNQYVDNIAIYFSSPLKQGLNITVYYAEDTHGYGEEFTFSANASKGSQTITFLIGREITTCRIDIGSKTGEEFVLESIVLNDSRLSDVGIFKTVVRFLLVIFFIIILYVLTVVRPKIEKAFLLIMLPLGLFYLVTITPLSVPDEPHHYQSAYQLSNFLLFRGSYNAYGNAADFDYTNFVGHGNVGSGYLRVLEDITQPAVDGELIEIPLPRKLAYFIEYIPQALGISIARVFHQNFIILFLLGRFFNLLFYISCVYLAIKRIPRFKLLLGLISITPMALQQAASYSYDSFINGVAFILIASLLKAIYEKGPLTTKDFNYILIAGLLLAPTKIVYYPILFLFLLIPRERFKGKKDKWIKFGIVLASAFLIICIFQMPSLLSRSIQKLNWEGQQNYSLMYVFENPIETARIFWRTFWTDKKIWLYQGFGISLSGLSLHIPSWIIFSFIFIVCLSALSFEMSSYRLRTEIRASFLFVSFIIMLLIMLSMFTQHTSDTRTIIMGVQGRYFIPIFPLLFISLNNQVLVYRKHIENVLLLIAVFLQSVTVLTIINMTN
ncbi:DUF2142 domain-containing protein [Anaerotruncus colihominis]|uniref:DUF2142 domain-containing protein n=1 Tax=Anaerotruncus colihominis DSM 17241 TaxID=445972 RepID=B0PBK2_9FIRM|nr:DUF2142 domain-containing protein [Anaerotruncus colihominis]EDS10977.1 hypothetical protein ANACOL_02158 [Anaerotruncus colihominis DSM 17241]UWN74981.1 DUF2142 domain-containing protein [Anaerotruncus colihominis]